LTAALGELAAPHLFARIARVAYPVALAFLIADLVCLVLDLGDSWRFHHMLRIFKPSSPMSLGTWCLTVYSLPLAIAAALSLLGIDTPALEWVRKLAVILAIFPAFGVAVYKGVLLSTTAQPGWRDGRWLGGYLTSSAFVLGFVQMLLLALVLGEARARDVARIGLVVLLLVNLVLLLLLAIDLRGVLARVCSPAKLAKLAVIGLVGETLIPIALLLSGNWAFPELVAVLLLLAGGLMTRFEVVRLPHQAAEC
jgi:Ni/Fe-hydrogenase subunit HybB-like protein